MSRNKCGGCDLTIKKNEGVVECAACKKKYHGDCSKLSDNEFAVISSKTKLKWFCSLCNDDVVDILNNYEKFKKVSATIEAMKNEVDEKVSQFEIRLAALEKETSKKAVIEKVAEQVKISSEMDREESELIKMKEQNLIYFNVPESECELIEDKMKHDFKLLSEAYNKHIKHDDISSMFRVGKKVQNKTRPLVVKYGSLEIKNNMLKKSGKLSIKYQSELKPIYTSIDRTQKQREAHKKLVLELKSRKSRGEEDIVIRNNKIVQHFRRESAAERITWASLFQ